jgi:trehalose 6-phosphate synthase
MSRLIVVSNRVEPELDRHPAAGGLAVAIAEALQDREGLWFGWSGELVEQPGAAVIQRGGSLTCATVDLTRRDYDQYYRGFSNSILWPACHSRGDLISFDRKDYAGYLRVNAQFARRLVELLEPDDLIWVHDYHLLPFAQALRDLGVRNPIGFFLHIPFPAPDMLRAVPPHEELVRAMCAYDVLGFQTENDKQAFVDYIERRGLGSSGEDGVLHACGRVVKVGAYPIGVRPQALAQAAVDHSERPQVQALRTMLDGSKLIIGIDRLDYSKGLVERFQAFERLLEQTPSWQRRVSLLQIAPPTRTDVPAYKPLRHQLEQEMGRINGRFSQLDWTPIHYMNRKYERRLLMGLLRHAHVGFVTPLRDGMNLVAKEYVAAQNPDDPGVLVLSEFAGAAAELSGALIVNPYDPTGMAQALDRALSMPLVERRARHADNFAILRKNDLPSWRNAFMADLGSVAATTAITRRYAPRFAGASR